MGKIALIVLLLGLCNPGAEIDVEGNKITMDRNNGSPVVVIEVKDGEPAVITEEEAAEEAAEEATEEAEAEASES
ncbi:hypothetical protein [Paenibacillus sp.]|uniref:hypothetical protein n=1 Tax=Paenibacillus sp. TaxID=58172 RepID=UPI002812441E|nr:hypothetical protein [Paenibacillus sp.]